MNFKISSPVAIAVAIHGRRGVASCLPTASPTVGDEAATRGDLLLDEVT
jgi:hypothetical protein